MSASDDRVRLHSSGGQDPPEPPQVATRYVLLAVAGLGGLIVLALALAWLLLRWNDVDPAASRGAENSIVEPRGTLRGFSERRETSTGIDQPPAIPRAMTAIAARPDPYAPLSDAEVERFWSAPEPGQERSR